MGRAERRRPQTDTRQERGQAGALNLIKSLSTKTLQLLWFLAATIYLFLWEKKAPQMERLQPN